jgi:8-oxo-dGTP diphosphatase
MNRPIKVVCGIIQSPRGILAVQRSASMSLPFTWEFPGGKIESGETEEACLIREIREELNIDITLEQRLTPVEHHYDHISIILIPFLARYVGGTLRLHEHQAFRWLKKEEMRGMDWAAADVPIMKEFLSYE